VVVGISPAYPYPDAAAHGEYDFSEPTYDVRFKSRDLWPDGCEAADVHWRIPNYLLTEEE
jgi:nitrile hydratase